MRLIKPKKLGYLQRCYGLGKDYYYVASPVLFFDLHSGEILVENQQWSKVTASLKDEALDHGLPKTCGEFCVAGLGYPSQKDSDKADVTVTVGKQSKTLTITGARNWKSTLFFGTFPSSPEVIKTGIPLTWRNAWGGEGYLSNPMGTGFLASTALPAVEYPIEHARSPGKALTPASFMPWPVTWPQRTRFQGHYKGDWFEKYFPAYAPDTDPRLFNACPTDQQIDGFFQGGEHYSLKGFDPVQPEIKGQIPEVRVRAMVNIQNQLQDVPLQADTLWLMPEVSLGAVIFRGRLPIKTMEASEVTDVLLAYERLSDEKKSLEEYQQVFALRTDSATALENAMNEAQLSPGLTEQQQQQRQQKIASQREQKKQARIQQQQQQVLASTGHGAVLASTMLPEPEMTPMDDILEEDLASGNIDLKPILRHAAKKVSEAEKHGDQQLAQLHQRFPQQAQPQTPTLDVLQASLQLNTSAQQGEDAKTALLAKQMSIQPEQKLAVSPQASDFLRQQVMERLKQGQPLSGLDLTGADLSGLTFKQIECIQTVFSFCDLTGCHFEQCQLGDCALTNARLADCQFVSCSMKNTLLQGTIGNECQFTDCDLSTSQWRNVSLGQCQIKQCQLDSALILTSELAKLSIIQCSLDKLTLNKVFMADSDWKTSQLNSCTFSECNLQMSRWHDCEITRCVMQMSQLQLSVYEQVKAHKWVFSTGSALHRSLWFDCSCELTSLRTVQAPSISIVDCLFQQGDFSHGNLKTASIKHSRLISCVAAGTQFQHSEWSECNLYQSRFRGAWFDHAKFTSCNFLQADMMWVNWGQSEIIEGKNFSRVSQRDLAQRNTKAA